MANISDKSKYLLLKSSIEGLKSHLNTISVITNDDLDFIKNYLDYILGVTDGIDTGENINV